MKTCLHSLANLNINSEMAMSTATLFLQAIDSALPKIRLLITS